MPATTLHVNHLRDVTASGGCVVRSRSADNVKDVVSRSIDSLSSDSGTAMDDSTCVCQQLRGSTPEMSPVAMDTREKHTWRRYDIATRCDRCNRDSNSNLITAVTKCSCRYNDRTLNSIHNDSSGIVADVSDVFDCNNGFQSTAALVASSSGDKVSHHSPVPVPYRHYYCVTDLDLQDDADLLHQSANTSHVFHWDCDDIPVANIGAVDGDMSFGSLPSSDAETASDEDGREPFTSQPDVVQPPSPSLTVPGDTSDWDFPNFDRCPWPAMRRRVKDNSRVSQSDSEEDDINDVIVQSESAATILESFLGREDSIQQQYGAPAAKTYLTKVATNSDYCIHHLLQAYRALQSDTRTNVERSSDLQRIAGKQQ